MWAVFHINSKSDEPTIPVPADLDIIILVLPGAARMNLLGKQNWKVQPCLTRRWEIAPFLWSTRLQPHALPCRILYNNPCTAEPNRWCSRPSWCVISDQYHGSIPILYIPMFMDVIRKQWKQPYVLHWLHSGQGGFSNGEWCMTGVIRTESRQVCSVLHSLVPIVYAIGTRPWLISLPAP